MREQIYLAALLHDIGKFYQRADVKLLKDYTSEHEVKMKSLICPENEFGGFGYQHAWWTYKFFEDKNQIFDMVSENGKPVFKVEVNENTNQDNLVNLAIYHHLPKTDIQKLIQLADWWSSGLERTEQNMEKENDNRYGKFKYKKVRLKNLLNLINREDLSATMHLPLSELDILEDKLDQFNAPTNLQEQGLREASQEYGTLWGNFKNQFDSLPTDSVKGFFESLLFLLQKFTWRIPASTNDLAHVSLYEHLKTTAAIALSLYDYQQESKCSYQDLKNNDTVFPLLLSCWDISGIQKFIYNVSGRKAAVSLKGRSFYLHLLMETIRQKVLDHPAVRGFSGQVIYSSGGKMFILLPNTPKCKNALNDVHREFEQILWEEHREQLYVNHGFIPFRCNCNNRKTDIIYHTGSQQQTGSLGNLWAEVVNAAAANKHRKYHHLLSSNAIEMEVHGEWGSDYALCAVTGREGKIQNDLVKLDTYLWVLKSVKQQIELGEALKDVDYVITYLHQDVVGHIYLKNRMDTRKEKHLKIGNIHHYLFDQDELRHDDANFRNITSADVSRVRRVNDTDFHRITMLKGRKSAYGYSFYGGNKQAEKLVKENGKEYIRNKTFEDLCWKNELLEKNENGESEKTYLGVLRMDVDNLGKIFKEGIPENLRSFATYSTLSAQLDWFFSGYLNTIRNSEYFKNTVNIIYSGGDDIFAVGRWDKMIAFAEKIRDDFRKFTGGREDISISAGIVIVGEKYPIRLAATEAGKAEDQSKEFIFPDKMKPEKNAITFFGQTVSWNKEFKEVEKIKKKLVCFCSMETKPLSKALLHQLMLWKQEKDRYENSHSKALPAFKWHTAYYLKRYMERYDAGETKDFLQQLQRALMSGEGLGNEKFGTRIYDLAALAARWAEMELKEFSNGKN